MGLFDEMKKDALRLANAPLTREVQRRAVLLADTVLTEENKHRATAAYNEFAGRYLGRNDPRSFLRKVKGRQDGYQTDLYDFMTEKKDQ